MIGKILILLFLTLNFTKIVTRDAPPVIIPDQGIVMGTYLKMYRTQSIMAYLGIPYALIEQRFSPPVVDQLPNWQGVRNCSIYPPDCFQTTKRPLKKHDELFLNLLKTSHLSYVSDEMKRYDENCLFVNVFIPDAPAPMEGYAVIAWLHSGDFAYGSANALDPFQLVFKQKVIVVTIAYRLNIFGFLTTADGEASGNFGLMDQSAALLWIKRNIKLFGGNEDSITLMGHGAGAVCVGLHLTSGDWSAGVFHKAIMMSGNLLSDNAVRAPEAYLPALDAIADYFGCFRRPTSKLMECLRRINATILAENLPYIEWGPVVDAGLSNVTFPFVSDYPRNLVERGMIRDIPLFIGYTDMEEVLDIIVGDMMETEITTEIYDTMLSDIIVNDLGHLETNESTCGNLQIVIDAVKYAYVPYPPVQHGEKLRRMYVNFHTDRKFIAPTILLANHISKKINNTYVYRFDIKPKTAIAMKSIQEWVGVPQSFDLIFVWGIPYWTNPEGYNTWENTDKRISDIIMTLWTNFAKYADPIKSGVYIKWDPYTMGEQKILVIDRAFNMTDDMNFRGIQFWNDYYPKVVQHAINCCNATNTSNQYSKFNNYNFLIILITFSTVLLLLQKTIFFT